MYLLPDPKKKTKKKSKVQKKTLEPAFDETFEYTLPEPNPYTVVQVSLWDTERIANSLIGEVDVPLADLLEEGRISQWYDLSVPDSGHHDR